MKKAISVTIFIWLWISFPTSVILADNSNTIDIGKLANDLNSVVNNQINDAYDLRNLQKSLDRLNRDTSPVKRQLDQADSLIQQLNDQSRLNDQRNNVENKYIQNDVASDPQIRDLQLQLKQSQLELSKAKKIDQLTEQIKKNQAETKTLANKNKVVASSYETAAPISSTTPFNATGTPPKVTPKKSALAPEDGEKIIGQATEIYNSGTTTNRVLYDQPIAWQTGVRYSAYAVADVSPADQLHHLVYIIDNGLSAGEKQSVLPLAIDPGLQNDISSGNGTVGGTVYLGAGFIVLSAPDKSLADTPVRAVIVNDLFYSGIETLAKAYPGIIFIRADQAAERLDNLTVN